MHPQTVLDIIGFYTDNAKKNQEGSEVWSKFNHAQHPDGSEQSQTGPPKVKQAFENPGAFENPVRRTYDNVVKKSNAVTLCLPVPTWWELSCFKEGSSCTTYAKKETSSCTGTSCAHTVRVLDGMICPLQQ